MTAPPVCAFCAAPLEQVFADLGMSPLSNGFVPRERKLSMEVFFPLIAYVCGRCFLVQVPQFEAPENIFSETYAYFSSFSDTWLRHVQRYVGEVIRRYELGSQSRVVEIASNDGYLLQFFVGAGIPALGIEPALNCARAAEERGVETWNAFFGTQTAGELAKRGLSADLLLGNNVLAHVPDVNDFVAGLRTALKPDGVITMEFPHLVRLIEGNQFDTIYHEHFSYFSFTVVKRIFEAHGLRMFDVEELPTHGGSLRIHAQHAGSGRHPEQESVGRLVEMERAFGVEDPEMYAGFTARVEMTKRAFVRFLIDAREAGKKVLGYGAPAKANTLLNYCGVRSDLIEFTVDRSPHKQGTFLPGTRIPVHHPDELLAHRPDYVVILPWNIRDEVMTQMAEIRSWGGKFVVAVPELEVLA